MMFNFLTFLGFATINSCDFLKFDYLQHIIRASLSSNYKRSVFLLKKTFASKLAFQIQYIIKQFYPRSYHSLPTMITPSEAVVWRCSIKKVLLEISQNSQGNTCARVSLILKERLCHKCFPVNFGKFLRIPFPFLIEHPWWLLLLLVISKYSQQLFTY